jgi:hypothetical protein
MNGWVLAFLVAQLLASGVAVVWGGAPERVAATLLALAAAATTLLPRPSLVAYDAVFWGVLWVDLALLIALSMVAATADRFWPMWLAALQLVTLATHGVRGYDSSLLPWAYWLMAGKIAYPMMALLVIGTVRHRERKRAGLPEYGWTAQRHADERRAAGALAPALA